MPSVTPWALSSANASWYAGDRFAEIRTVIGARFGAFQVLRRIASGAVATVYLASDGDEVCAVKVFDSSFRSRAEREFGFGHGLDHPRLNSVDALLDIDGYATVKMPFVPGVQLTKWLGVHGDRRTVVSLMSDVLDALAYLHDRDVVHRDVKPENILVPRDDRPTLIDFDLAARRGERIGERGWVGTAAYLSPSRLRGEPASPADDLYSVGVVSYLALTGTLPFEGSFEEVLEAHGSLQPPAPSSHRPELAAIDPWMTRALAKHASEGFGSAAEMREELAALASTFGR
jgi:serine/threonine protein kinase